MSAERIELEQGSPAWHEYRATVVNASEAGALMNCGRFKPRNVVELLARRRGELDVYQNDAMRRGNALEPVVRDVACETLGLAFVPAVYRNGRFSASLDGICGREGLEIKCPSSAESELFLCGDAAALKRLAPYYFWQLVAQFYAAELALVWFVVYHADRPTHFVAIQREQVEADIPALVEAGNAFLAHLDAGTTPDLGRSDEAFLDAATEYRHASALVAYFEELRDKAKERLVELGGGVGGGVTVSRVEGRKTVDYKRALGELAPGANLEPFTKQGAASWRVTEAK